MKTVILEIDCKDEFCGCCTIREFDYDISEYYCRAFEEHLGEKDGITHRHWKCIESTVEEQKWSIK